MALTEQIDNPLVPMWTLGDRLAKARRHAGLNQEQMAQRLNVTASALSAWESDRNQPRELLAVATRWAEVTGVDSAWILGVGSRTGSLSPLIGLTSNPAPELPFPPAGRQLAVVGAP